MELHLERKGGLCHTRQQLGRIARYIDARGLHETHPIVTATTYPKLAGIVQRIIPEMQVAAVTYVSPENEGSKLIDGVFESLEEFDTDNNHTHSVRTVDSLVVLTEQFVQSWRDRE